MNTNILFYTFLIILFGIQLYFLLDNPYAPYNMIIGFMIGWVFGEIYRYTMRKHRESKSLPLIANVYWQKNYASWMERIGHIYINENDPDFISITKIIAQELPRKEGEEILTLILSEHQIDAFPIYEFSIGSQEFIKVRYEQLVSYFSKDRVWIPELFIKIKNLEFVLRMLICEESRRGISKINRRPKD